MASQSSSHFLRLLRRYAAPVFGILLISVAFTLRVQVRPVPSFSKPEAGSIYNYLKGVWPSSGAGSTAKDLSKSPRDEPMLDLTILLHASQDTWETRGKAIRDTWLLRPLPANMQLFWVLDANVTNDPTIFINHRTKPGLKVRQESRAAMDERTIQAFVQVLLVKPPSRWYLKIDDDTFVNIANLQKTISSLAALVPSTSKVYAGHCRCTWKLGLGFCQQLYGGKGKICDTYKKFIEDGDGSEPYACGGPGYLLSRRSLEAVVAYEQLHGCPRGYEDMMMGWVMQGPLNVTCHHLDVFFAHWSEGGPENWDVRRLVTAHKVLPGYMYTLWNKTSSTASSTA